MDQKSIQMMENSENTSREIYNQNAQPASMSDAQYTFGFNVNISQILDLFENVSHQLNFEMIESEQTYAMAVKNGKKNFIQILDCFNWWTQSNMTAIKMTIHTSENDSKRKCKIKGLVGSRKQVMDFSKEFGLQSKSLIAIKQSIIPEQSTQIIEQQTNPFYLESCAAYMFHKILSNKNYGLGNLIHTSINNFNNTHEEAQKSVQTLPGAMKQAVTLTEEVVSSLYKDFNYGRQEMEQIMPYCRISVEKYIFQKIYCSLQNIYKAKNKKASQEFKTKKQKIVKQLSAKTIFKEIGLGEHLWLTNENEEDEDRQNELYESQTAKKYYKASKELQKIKASHCPREKVKYCQIMYTYLKTIIFEQSGGKNELFNMEDIIPILILILLLTNIENIKEELDMMVDFIGFDPCDLEGQRRLLVNLSESFNYIVRDWNIQ